MAPLTAPDREMKTPDVRSSMAARGAGRRKRRRREAPPCRCLALCIGVILLSSSSSSNERSTSLIGGVRASEHQPPPTAASSSSSSSHRSGARPPRFRFAIPSVRRGFPDDDDEDMGADGSSFFVGAGREFDLFDTRGGVSDDSVAGGGGDYGASPLHPFTSHPRPNVSSPNQPPPSNNPNIPLGQSSYPSYTSSTANRAGGRAYSSSSTSNRRRRGSRSSSSWYGSSSASQSGPGFHRAIVEPVQNWWSSHVAPNVKSWPKLTCRVEPTTTLKIRKTFRPIGTIVRLGADFNTQLGVWQFKSSWEDAFLGGKLTLAGRELQLTKSWQLSVTAVEDLVTRLRCRAAVDLQTWKAYVRVGFRTERLSPINVVEGFTILKQIPLDGTKGHVKLEVKAILSLPEPEIEYSTETQRSLVGMGDIEVNVEELNLLLDY